MDKEMKARVDEILKENDIHELSLDEMDKVNGGRCFEINGVLIQTAEDVKGYCLVLEEIEKQFGRDFVAAKLKKDFDDSNTVTDYYSRGLDQVCNRLIQLLDGSTH